ncbi:MAG: 50S ribosomal protein L18 [Deltaproteobacteria bacterium]|nr:50S ribosomal protein L18 [Deltaproteobacteria bacterium]MBW1872127.1 50S ribosomal protein L18 [Deltaproteobacteria bacterium]
MISNIKDKRRKRIQRRRRIRRKLIGTPERPRLSVFRSAKHTYAQVIDDQSGRVLVAASTMDKEIRDSIKKANKSEAAEKVGEVLAQRCAKKEVKKVVFDRNGFTFHGRLAKLAHGAREKGLSF